MSELPDFDEMDALAEKAARARAKMKLLERVESMIEAEFMRRAIDNKDYWIRDRPPAAAILEKVYGKIGMTKDDRQSKQNIAEEIAKAYEVYTEASEKLQTCRDRIAVFQTESANKRFARM